MPKPPHRPRHKKSTAPREPATRRQSTSPPKPAPARNTRRPAPPLTIRWTGFRVFHDYWGAELKRSYQLDTLASATERLIRTQDRFIAPSVQQILGPSPLTSLEFELFQEGRFQLIFRLRAANAKRNTAPLAFVVAKRDGDISRIAESEHANLRQLHERAPELVTRPFRGGRIFLPARRKAFGPGREVYAYLTQWQTGYHELGIHKNLQFLINTKKPHLLTLEQTEELKTQIIAVIAALYQPERRLTIEIPQIASGDFLVTHPQHGPLKVKLIACRRFVRNVTPARLIHRMILAHWDWGGREFRIVPSDPAAFLEGLERGAGAKQARLWLQQYNQAIKHGQIEEHPYLTHPILDELLASPGATTNQIPPGKHQ